MLRTLTAAALTCAAVAAAPAVARADTPRPADAAVGWNQFLLDLQAAPNVQPATVHPTYELAIMHAAVYDAVVAIDSDGAPYLTSVRDQRGASATAAADAAAHDTLVALYPGLRPPIDQQYATLLGQLPAGRSRAE